MTKYYGPFEVNRMSGDVRGLWNTFVAWDKLPFKKADVKQIYLEEKEIYSPSEIVGAFIFAPSGPVIDYLRSHAILWYVYALVCIDNKPRFVKLPIRGSWDVPNHHLVRSEVREKVLRLTAPVAGQWFVDMRLPTRGDTNMGMNKFPDLRGNAYGPVTSAQQAVDLQRSPSPCTTDDRQVTGSKLIDQLLPSSNNGHPKHNSDDDFTLREKLRQMASDKRIQLAIAIIAALIIGKSFSK
jgi:hypothetical protein